MPTHASFFSGAGGLDIGLERGGWTTVSFSEIDPYASAVLAERWPGIPNLGDIVDVASWSGDGPAFSGRRDGQPDELNGHRRRVWADADLWTGGFPCQDLSVAGKRRGMGTADARTRSGLAYAFLDLVERHRPPAILLENVPGLLSSNAGRDLGALLRRLEELLYVGAGRVLDARYFGVPQRRRRVFILAVDTRRGLTREGAAEVLSVGTRCPRHPATGHEAGPGAAFGATPGVDIARAVTGSSGKRHDDDTDTLIANGLRASDGHHGHGSPRGDGGDNLVVGPSPDAGRDGTTHGLARRLDDRVELAPTLRVGGRASGAGSSYDNTPIIAATLNSGGNSGGFRTEPGEHLVPVYVKGHRASSVDDDESWRADDTAPTVNGFDVGDTRATVLIEGTEGDDPLLPLGLDSHRYRCCGNGVVSGVSEWIGIRLAGYLATLERAA